MIQLAHKWLTSGSHVALFRHNVGLKYRSWMLAKGRDFVEFVESFSRRRFVLIFQNDPRAAARQFDFI